MEKIKLNALETENLTKIKREDIKKLIKDANYVLDALYYDKQVAYMPGVMPSGYVNPVQDIYKLIETIEFMDTKYNKGEWEKNSTGFYDPEGDKENKELHNVIFGLRQSLHNAISHAITDSQFKDKYEHWHNAYNKNLQNSPFLYAKEKLTNKIEEEAGWVPTYQNGKISYSYFTEYDGQYISLDNIERYDEKPILTPQLVKEKINRSF